ncbi:MAG: hypothetical protein ABI742_00750 [Gemmatimonadota bacterium]
MRAYLLAAALLAGCHPGGNGAPAPAGGPLKTTVHAVLTTPSLTGRMVEVNGRCLGYSAPTIAKGSPPLTRSDWQLEDQGEAIWVSGPLPAGCTSTTPASAPGLVTATVAQDTLPGLGGQSAAPRQYLVRN